MVLSMIVAKARCREESMVNALFSLSGRPVLGNSHFSDA
jgi:hypothetical protein